MADFESAPDQVQATDSQPAKTPMGTSSKIAIGCGAIMLIPILLIAGVIWQYTSALNAMTQTPTTPPEVVALQPAAKAFDSAFTAAMEENLPDLAKFEGVVNFAPPMPCLEEWATADACSLFELDRSPEQRDKEICEGLLTAAMSVGADSALLPGEVKMRTLDERSPSDCERTLGSDPKTFGLGRQWHFYVVKGTTPDGTPFAALLLKSSGSPANRGDLTEEQVTSLATEQMSTGNVIADTFSYSIISSTMFDNPDLSTKRADYEDSKVQVAAMLDTFAQMRLANPYLETFNAGFAAQILDTYTTNFKPKGSVSAVKAKDVSVHWIQVDTADDSFDVCVSVGVGPELKIGEDGTKETGMAVTGLPGVNVELMGLGQPVPTMTDKTEFGDYKLGTCN